MGRRLLCDCEYGKGCHGLVLIEFCSPSTSTAPPTAPVLFRAAADKGIATARKVISPWLRFVTPGGAEVPPRKEWPDDRNSRAAAPGAKRPRSVFIRGKTSASRPAPAVEAATAPAPRPRARQPAENLVKVNESLRSRRAHVHRGPGWPKAWRVVVDTIRGFPQRCFWEIFSGSAGLSKEFKAQGWFVGPPIDILFDVDLDVLNPEFRAVCIGLIFENRIRLLHLGPPCSSFSMACNRFFHCRLRSRTQRAGLANLRPLQKVKVSEGNGLADVATELGIA